MLPTVHPGVRRREGSVGRKSHSSMGTYLKRLAKPGQMDFQYTFWLMWQLCLSPKTVYRHTTYHRETKQQWSRDDPAYVIICCFLVAIAASFYCLVFGDSFWHSLMTILSAVLIDFLLIGCGIATAGWILANRFLRKRGHTSHSSDQQVEWMYAFDVHCNSYFPLFLLLYVLQFIASPILLWNSFLASIMSNFLYAAAFGYYHYLSFLGYSALPFLDHTEVFLWPIAVIVLMLPFTILFGFNPTRFTLGIYFDL